MNPSRSFPFNIRVYGIYIRDGRLLVSDEQIAGRDITKFPGGGLHFGEGPVDCIRREMMEETGQEFEVLQHFYTTDFFQLSAFNPGHQVISIYYLLKAVKEPQFRISGTPFDYPEPAKQSFRWLNAEEVSGNVFTLPIDKAVGDLLVTFLQAQASKI